MTAIENDSIKVKNYKCFGDEEQGFGKILPINVIVGRNNSGKSTLLELIQYVAHPDEAFQRLGYRRTRVPEVFLSHQLNEDELSRVFKKDTSGGPFPGNHWAFGSKLIDSIITYKLEPDNKHQFVDIATSVSTPDGMASYWDNLARHTPNPLSGRIFKRLRSERDIVPEGDQWPLKVQENGEGTTGSIVAFITNSTLPSELVEETLLTALNKIYEPDSSFSRISVQRIGAGTTAWEVHLKEESTQVSIALSQTGSGFKTILLALVYLYLIPSMEGQPIKNYIFAFEELENNLHPAVQRRLLLFLREFVLEHGCHLFLTTHSSVIIDLFSRDNQAQIIHTTYDGEKAKARCVQTYIESKGICDDLGVRASDLLQANSIVWVEGPSDRLYVDRWIDVWTDGELKEGVHYQCMFYGGRLLAHISGYDPETLPEDAIPILRLNRNAIIILDSDKKSSHDDINSTKKRIIYEIEQMGGVAWITEGNEIENYIPSEVIAKYCQKPDLIPLDKFVDIADYLDENIAIGEGKKFRRGKVEFAANICPQLTKDNLKDTLDLASKLTEVCDKIKHWNKL